MKLGTTTMVETRSFYRAKIQRGTARVKFAAKSKRPRSKCKLPASECPNSQFSKTSLSQKAEQRHAHPPPLLSSKPNHSWTQSPKPAHAQRIQRNCFGTRKWWWRNCIDVIFIKRATHVQLGPREAFFLVLSTSSSSSSSVCGLRWSKVSFPAVCFGYDTTIC